MVETQFTIVLASQLMHCMRASLPAKTSPLQSGGLKVGCDLLVGQIGVHVRYQAVDLLLHEFGDLHSQARSCQHDLQHPPVRKQ